MPEIDTPERDFVIEREEGPTKGRYFLRLDEYEAVMTYSRAGANVIIIDQDRKSVV